MKSAREAQDAKVIRWSQWSPIAGMIRCGEAPYRTIMNWMKDLERDAKKCLDAQDKPHAVYGRVMHDYEGRLSEIRLYSATYLTDEELEAVAFANVFDTFYVVHK